MKTVVPAEKKTSRRVENQQTQPTCDAKSENRTGKTLVGGECYHQYGAPRVLIRLYRLNYGFTGFSIGPSNESFFCDSLSRCQENQQLLFTTEIILPEQGLCNGWDNTPWELP